MTRVLFDFVSIVYQIYFYFRTRSHVARHVGIWVVYTEHYALAVNSSYRVIG